MPDSAAVSDLTIPGTHQSCARYDGPTMGFAKCQNTTFDVAAQLALGVRYLDVRCCVRRRALRLHHAFVHQHGTIDDVLVCCALFLRDYSGETIVMRLRQESSTAPPGEFRRLFEERVTSLGLADTIYTKRAIPLLKEVRGRIVLLSGPCYVGGLRWKDDATMAVQDDWTVTRRAAKLQVVVDHVERAMRRAQSPGRPGRLFINHASGHQPPWLTPRAFAAYVNPRVSDAVRGLAVRATAGDDASGLGIVAMDFADDAVDLVELLIGWNFRSIGAGVEAPAEVVRTAAAA